MCLLQLYVGSSQYYTGNSFNQAPASLKTNAIMEKYLKSLPHCPSMPRLPWQHEWIRCKCDVLYSINMLIRKVVYWLTGWGDGRRQPLGDALGRSRKLPQFLIIGVAASDR